MPPLAVLSWSQRMQRPAVLRRRYTVLAGLALLVLVTGLYVWRHGHVAPLAPTRPAAASAAREEIPRIDLARLDSPREQVRVGRRDIFEFGTLEEEGVPTTTAAVASTPPPAPVATQPPLPATPPPPRLPPLNLKYIGSLENGRGLRVAVLLTDRNEVLTGQAGEVVANRYRIVKIGYESIDLEELGSGQVRRLPLRGS